MVMKTKKEEFLDALKGHKQSSLIWSVDIEGWLTINKLQSTLPASLANCQQIDAAKAITTHLWCQADPLLFHYESPVEHHISLKGDVIKHEFSTPEGNLSFLTGSGTHCYRARGILEYMIKNESDIHIAEYLARHMSFEHHPETTLKLLSKVGDDGVVLVSSICSPFVKFAAFDAGYMNAFFLLKDYQKAIDSLLATYGEKFLEAIKILCEGPQEIILINDELDGTLISPEIFSRYILPFYKEAKKIVAASGKLCGASWTGKTKKLLQMAVDTTLDFISGILVKPMSDFSIEDILQIFDGKITFFGGIPTVYLIKNVVSDTVFDAYIKGEILPLKNKSNFVLGVSDCLPPDADFERLKKIHSLIINNGRIE